MLVDSALASSHRQGGRRSRAEFFFGVCVWEGGGPGLRAGSEGAQMGPFPTCAGPGCHAGSRGPGPAGFRPPATPPRPGQLGIAAQARAWPGLRLAWGAHQPESDSENPNRQRRSRRPPGERACFACSPLSKRAVGAPHSLSERIDRLRWSRTRSLSEWQRRARRPKVPAGRGPACPLSEWAAAELH